MKLDRRYNGKRIVLEVGDDREAAGKYWDTLVREQRDDLIAMLFAKTVTLPALMRMNAETAAAEAAFAARVRMNLWDTVDRVCAGDQPGRKRYRDSFAALRELGGLPNAATVLTLTEVDWTALEARWGRSAADWNHLRRAVSWLLGQVCRNRHHPLRMETMFRFPKRDEEARVPEVDVQALTRITDPALKIIVTFLVTFGLRAGEYWALRRDHYAHGVLSIPGTKTDRAKRKIRVPPALHEFVLSAVPAPLSYKLASDAWRAVREQIGLSGVRLHDLRHVFAQESAAAVDLRALADLMGHSNVQQTYKYAKRAITDVPVNPLLFAEPKEVPLVN